MKKDILWVSLCTPYSAIPHAGGQTLCHYYEELVKLNKFNINFISFYSDAEQDIINKTLLCNKSNIILMKEKDDVKSKIIDIENRINPWNRYGGYLSNSREKSLKKALYDYKAKYGSPDYIILQWTEIVIYAAQIKKTFPKSKIIAIEEDVSFLKRERRYKASKKCILRMIHKLRYKHSKECELRALNLSDLIVVNNEKDKNLIMNNGIEKQKVFTSCPYFKKMEEVNYKRKNKDIIFWGAMGRKENSDSAIWFIDNVMPKIESEGYRFVVVGSNPPTSLLNKECNNVKITGFVTDPKSYFSDSFCLVAPLVIGAGIKVKILEALSAGIPVITNEIGIEGIPAVNGINYYYAKTVDDYINAIHELSMMNDYDIKSFSNSEKDFIDRTFNFEKKVTELVGAILDV